jgi:hypothetical protein
MSENTKQPDFNSIIIKKYKEKFKEKYNISLESSFYVSQKYTTNLLVGIRDKKSLFSILYGESKATKSFKWRIYSKDEHSLTKDEISELKNFIIDLNKGSLSKKEFKNLEELLKSLGLIKENLYLYDREETTTLIKEALNKFTI